MERVVCPCLMRKIHNIRKEEDLTTSLGEVLLAEKTNQRYLSKVDNLPPLVISFNDIVPHQIPLPPDSSDGVQQGIFGTRDSHFLRRDIEILGFKTARNGIRYSHGTWNVLIFLLRKREKYEMVAGYRDK